mmetsp:Transcript_14297/g.38782  ORF Transcript_14297/g.38782 Transcript_14297/m.38782 type:complete len:214 (+) Transcript_14297:872-1513(+)
MGVMSSSRSLPYKHSPASSRSESRGPKPANRTREFSISFCVRASALLLCTLISKPSSPVYPVRVAQIGMPAASKVLKLPKYCLDRSALVKACRASAAAGPCKASRLRSSCTVIATCLPCAFHSLRCLFKCAKSLSRQPAFTTTYSSSSDTLITTVSSITPPRSLVYKLRQPVPFSRPAMSPTTRDSKNGMVSLPFSVKPHMWETSNREAWVRQ